MWTKVDNKLINLDTGDRIFINPNPDDVIKQEGCLAFTKITEGIEFYILLTGPNKAQDEFDKLERLLIGSPSNPIKSEADKFKEILALYTSISNPLYKPLPDM